MLDRLLPPDIDNTYRGHKAALWLFALLLLVRILMSVNTIFDGRGVAVNADGVPLDTFPPDAAQAFVSMSAAWALGQLVVSLLGALVLARYRAAVPLMFAFVLAEQVLRRLLFFVMPIAKAGVPPGFYVNLILITLTTAGLLLSVWNRDRRRNIS